MMTIGLVLATFGALALLGGVLQKHKAGRIANTPFFKTAEISGATTHPKRAVSTQGRVVPRAMVVSPITKTECLYYELDAVATWKVGEASRSQKMDSAKVAAQFAVDDGSGPAWVDASGGGDFELETTFKKSQTRGLKHVATGAALTFGDHGYMVVTGQKINGVLVPEDAKVEVVEKCLKGAPSFYVCGKLDEQNRIGSPSWASLMISPKQRDQLLGSTMAFAKRLLVGGGAVAATGAVLAVVGKLMGS